jgi:hypothetical protein
MAALELGLQLKRSRRRVSERPVLRLLEGVGARVKNGGII